MGISKGVTFVWLVTIFLCLLFLKVADADTEHFGIHAVGHAVEPFCPGGYSDRGDHCQFLGHLGRSLDENRDEDDDFDDTYKVTRDKDNKISISLTSLESTEEAEERAVGLGLENLTPEEQISDRVTVLGH